MSQHQHSCSRLHGQKACPVAQALQLLSATVRPTHLLFPLQPLQASTPLTSWSCRDDDSNDVVCCVEIARISNTM